ncbi:four helix bundle protein [Limibacterium fermenti]|uniref:four helix bundle protein n=1 Tax=Limibacterium fermenti TaxID=3229863 RepID=UPI003A710D38
MDEKMDKSGNVIVDLSFKFALDAIDFAEMLEQERKFVIGRQFLKSATSIGANVREAQNAESKTDFIHKIKIAAKEADETEYWLLLCKSSASYPCKAELLDEVNVIQKILNKIIGTSKSQTP